MPPEEERRFIDKTYFGMIEQAGFGVDMPRDVQTMPAPEPPVKQIPHLFRNRLTTAPECCARPASRIRRSTPISPTRRSPLRRHTEGRL
jgi:hypothetical protein